MFSKLASLLVFIGVFLLAVNCDPTVSPVDKLIDSPTVKSISITPNNIDFSPADGFKDTTLSIRIEATIENVDGETNLGYSIRDEDSQDLITNGELNTGNQPGIYLVLASLSTTTT